MAGYQLFSWERILPFLELLPEEEYSLAEVLHTETMKLLKQQHSVDSAAQAGASCILLRQQPWTGTAFRRLEPSSSPGL